jgi:hypothetical protein
MSQKAHNKYKNVTSRIEYILVVLGGCKLKEIRFALQTALNCLRAQNKKIEELEKNLLEAYKLIDDNLDFPVDDGLLDEVKEYNIEANKVLVKALEYVRERS